MKQLRNHKFIYIALGIILLISLILMFQAFKTAPGTPASENFVTPTPIGEQSEAQGQTNPPLRYAAGSGQKIVAKTKNRQPLPAPDAERRSTITDKLRRNNTQRSGIVYLSNAVRIEYLATANVFHGEIRTTDISAAKQEAVSWFREQGLSPEGICNLPLIFYLYSPVAEALRRQNIVFDPLPDGC